MGILDELVEKKDILAYINIRKTTLKMEMKKQLTLLPDDQKEKMVQRLGGRIRELDTLKRAIDHNQIREQSKALYHGCLNELENTRNENE
jgi:hypothetical protein